MRNYTTCSEEGCKTKIRTRQATGLCKEHWSAKGPKRQLTDAEKVRRLNHIIPVKIGKLHRSSSGIDFEQLEKGPMNYVRQLARYIRDASTVRARCMNHWGSAPKIETVREILAQAAADRAEYRAESERLGEDAEDAEDFRVRPIQSRNAIVQDRLAAEKKAANVLHFDAAAIIAKPASKDDAFVNSALIIERVAKTMRVSVEDILGPSRASRFVRVRRVICYILRQRGWSYPRIAQRLNRLDHTTSRSMIKHFVAHADERMRWVAAQFDVPTLADECEAA